jgi:hypothetical protein
MAIIRIGSRDFETPIMVPSVSSYETTIKPFDALNLQGFLREPITLVSAFDLTQGGKKAEGICEGYHETGSVLLDSGGYESQRHSKSFCYLFPGAEDEQRARELWNEGQYFEIAQKDYYDLIFSFDVFPTPNEPLHQFEERLLSNLIAHHNEIDPLKLIPVVHLVSRCGSFKYDESDTTRLISSIVRGIDYKLIAIPERELGHGIIHRASAASSIVSTLGSHGCGLHVLGCGNPLSFAFLAVAGITSADGLEWCRTVIDQNYHLHHYQHLEMAEDVSVDETSPAEALLHGHVEPSYDARVAITNLVRMKQFGDELRNALNHGKVSELVGRFFAHQLYSCLCGFRANLKSKRVQLTIGRM